MSGLLVAQLTLMSLVRSPIVWGLAVCSVGIWIMLAAGGHRIRRFGQLVAGAGLIGLAIATPKLSQLTSLDHWVSQSVFWLMSAIALGCSVAAISARNPVYTAIWFAGSLIGVAGLFMFQNAQFLGVATIVVYAGAIVVTFLFVLMLANPEGNARYDRVGWAKFPTPLMVIATLALTAVLAVSIINQRPAAAETTSTLESPDQIAHLGGELFAKHLVSVEVIGTLLLVALVGAVAIVIQGKSSLTDTHPSASRTDSSTANSPWLGRQDGHRHG